MQKPVKNMLVGQKLGARPGEVAGAGAQHPQTPVALLLSLSFSSTRDHLVTAPMLALEYLPSSFVPTRADLTCLTHRKYVVTSPCRGSIPSTPWAEPTPTLTPTAEHGPGRVLTGVCAGPRDTKVGASPVPGGRPAFTKLQEDCSVGAHSAGPHREQSWRVFAEHCLVSSSWSAIVKTVFTLQALLVGLQNNCRGSLGIPRNAVRDQVFSFCLI